MNVFQNPLEAVQLIPIFSYLNALSEFLIITNYLPENDHNKQIPAVNALYEYLHDNRKNKFENIELIRNLLKGSDMYGSRDDEYIDITFANAMIEHIITSLVFNKFGNIYGFLANTFLEAKNLEIDQILQLLRTNLEKLSFENEYGDNSQLTPLAVDGIFSDIISPLFPPGKNINLLSHDYIYAQVGLMFLRAGKANTVYYADTKYLEPKQETFIFDEHLITGYLIENFLLTKETNFEMIKAFALPALTYYIFNSKYLFLFLEIANVISETEFWNKAYEHLFQYLMIFYQNMEFNYQSVYIPKIYLSTFQKSDQTNFNQEHCGNLQKVNKTDSGLSLYFYNIASYQCEADHSLNYHTSEVNNIISLYETQDLQLLQDAFPKSLMKTFENSQLVIKLIIPSNREECDHLFQSKDLPFDIFEFYYPDKAHFDYYILKRDKYNFLLSNERILFTSSTLKLLKTKDETMTNFFCNLIEYKISRLKEYLKIQDQTEGSKEEIKKNWWEEFGLSPVVYYPCQTTETNTENICEADQIEYADNCQKYLCTTIKSVIYKRMVNKTVGENLPEGKNTFTMINTFNDSIFEDISYHLSNPDFQLSFTKSKDITTMQRIIGELKEQTNFNFTTVTNSLLRISILKSTYFHKIATIKESNQSILVNTLFQRPHTGYGYKFIFAKDVTTETAVLRTGHELQDLRFFIQDDRNKYIALNNLTLNIENDHVMYEINNRLFRRPNKFLFSRIPIPPDDYDDNCSNEEYYATWKKSRCQRLGRFYQNSQDIKQAIEFIRKRTTLCETIIRNMLQKYTFPNIEKVTEFVNDYLENNSLKEPDWSRDYLVNNSQLLRKVRYDSNFETHNLTVYEGKLRINAIYSSAERREIEKEVSMGIIVKNFNEQYTRYSLTFHDYYAIRNYVTTGYRRIGANTKESKLMKIALYTLAIRQYDEQPGEFNSKLFRIETVPIQIFRFLSTEKNITLQKFTQTSPNVSSAMKYVGYPALGYVNIIYEMVFSGHYVNVKIEQVYRRTEENVILLPGSEFDVEGTEWLQIGGLGNVFKFKLKFRHFVNEKIVWYRKIMNAIEKISL